MFFRTLIPLAILAASAFAAVLDKRAVTCDTSAGSPSTSDAEAATAVVSIKGDANCCQSNNGGNLCTTLVTVGSAAVGLCGPQNSCFKCGDMGNLLLQVATQCKSGGKSGGQNSIDSTHHVIISHA